MLDESVEKYAETCCDKSDLQKYSQSSRIIGEVTTNTTLLKTQHKPAQETVLQATQLEHLVNDFSQPVS